MICHDCVLKNSGKVSSHATTKQLIKCDWCGQEKYCAPDFKYGLDRKIAMTEEKIKVSDSHFQQINDALENCKLKLQHSTYEPATHQEIDHVTSWNRGVDACIATLDRMMDKKPSNDMPDIYVSYHAWDNGNGSIVTSLTPIFDQPIKYVPEISACDRMMSARGDTQAALDALAKLVGAALFSAKDAHEYQMAHKCNETIRAALTIASEYELVKKERDELARKLEDILHSAFEHGSKNLSGKTLDPDGEMLWEAKQLVNKIMEAKNEIR